MRRRTGLSLLAGLPWTLSACAVPVVAAPLRPLTADDFRASGQRGVGYGLLRFGDRSPADNDSLITLGAGHVRMFLEAERVPGTRAYRIDTLQWRALDAVMDSLQARSVRLLPVLSLGADARDGRDGNETVWSASALQDSAVDLWRQVALRTRGRAVIAGFDLLNEPVPPGLNYAARQLRWLALADRFVRAVRDVDPQRVLIVESAPDATGESFEHMRPLPFANLVYSMHSYVPFAFTHQTVAADQPQPMRYAPAEATGRAIRRALDASLQPVRRFAERHDVPIYVGEFSAPRWAPDGSAARYIEDSIASFQSHGWSWSYHEYRAWHGWDPEMDSASRQPGLRHADAPAVSVLRRALRAGRG